MIDADLAHLSRAVLQEGDVTQAPRLAAALARVKGEPVARLRKLVTKANSRCRVGDVQELTFHGYGRVKRVTACTVAWSEALACIRRSLLRREGVSERCAWEVGPSSWRAGAVTDTPMLLVVRRDDTGLVTVGVGITACKNPTAKQAWPMLGAASNPKFWDRLREWSVDFLADDRVVLTVDQARELAGKAKRPKRRRSLRRRDGARVRRGYEDVDLVPLTAEEERQHETAEEWRAAFPGGRS